MAIPLINSVVSWFLKKRIHDMELFMKHPQELQNNLLMDMIRFARHTEVGKKIWFCRYEVLSGFCRPCAIRKL